MKSISLHAHNIRGNSNARLKGINFQRCFCKCNAAFFILQTKPDTAHGISRANAALLEEQSNFHGKDQTRALSNCNEAQNAQIHIRLFYCSRESKNGKISTARPETELHRIPERRRTRIRAIRGHQGGANRR